MGANVAQPYESKGSQIANLEQNNGPLSEGVSGDYKKDFANMKAKRDGSFLRSKAEICRDYDESVLPWPIKPVVKLDYCWRVTYVMWKHSFILAAPLTMCHFIWQRQPHVWKYTLKTMPKLLLTLNYLVCVCLVNTVNIGYSVMFEDYCNRESQVYNPKVRNSTALRHLIKSTNDEHRTTLIGKSNQALSPDEIIGDQQRKV